MGQLSKIRRRQRYYHQNPNTLFNFLFIPFSKRFFCTINIIPIVNLVWFIGKEKFDFFLPFFLITDHFTIVLETRFKKIHIPLAAKIYNYLHRAKISSYINLSNIILKIKIVFFVTITKNDLTLNFIFVCLSRRGTQADEHTSQFTVFWKNKKNAQKYLTF